MITRGVEESVPRLYQQIMFDGCNRDGLCLESQMPDSRYKEKATRKRVA
jgi:hypothetical protein